MELNPVKISPPSVATQVLGGTESRATRWLDCGPAIALAPDIATDEIPDPENCTYSVEPWAESPLPVIAYPCTSFPFTPATTAQFPLAATKIPAVKDVDNGLFPILVGTVPEISSSSTLPSP